MTIVQALMLFVRLALGLSVTFAGLGAILAFGMFAFIGMPLLVIGLGFLSAAINDLANS